MNYKIFIYAGLLSFVAALTFACKAQVDTWRKARIEPNKPTVYVEFVKLDKRVDTDPFNNRSSEDLPPPPEEFEAVLLRVYNNSRLAIKFQTRATSQSNVEMKQLVGEGYVEVPLANAELELVYGVEPVFASMPVKAELKRKLPYIRLYSSCTDVWLPSGQSVVFVVRREELRENLQVFLQFKYEWEVSGQNKGVDEPEHRVYFRWWDFEKATGSGRAP